MSKVALVALLASIDATVVAGAGCSAADQAYIHAHKGSDSSSFGQSCAHCGYEAYSIFYGWNATIFDNCLVAKTQISESCADCYAGAGKYGAGNSLPDLKQCTGFEPDPVAPCSSELATVVAGAGCSAADQAYIHAHKGSDSSSFGQSCAHCGYEAYSVWSGFSKPKFDKCLVKKTGVSETCADCYADAGKYGAGNCKWACSSSWCPKKCLECTAAALPALKQCTGFEPDPVAPCSSELFTYPNMTVVV